MLKFKYKDTLCVIDDEYNIKCEGLQSELLKKAWEGIVALSLPSKPCPLDEMWGFMVDCGAEIIEYTPEFNPNVVY